MMKKPHLSIIIPVLNQWDLTRNCLESLRKHTPGAFFEVVVVDNGSSDKTPNECPLLGQALFNDRFHHVRVEQNINFGPGCNLGAEHASGELLFFLNNDTLLTQNWFAPLLQVFKTETTATACSPLCLFPDSDRIQHLGIGFDGSLGVKHPYYFFPGNHPVVRKNRRLQALSGATFMTTATTFREMHGFYPGYANGFEDIDLCCRIRRSGGRLIQENRSVIYHLASQTPGRNQNDDQNIHLINKRCAHCFTPDLHKIAIQDGYTCELTPWLTMIIRQPDTEKLARYDTLTTKSDIQTALNEEPLWEGGYDMLAALLSAEKNHAQAAQYLLYGATLFPSVDRLSRLSIAATQAKNDRLNSHATDAIANIAAIQASPKTLYERASKTISWAKDNGDTALATIYEHWQGKKDTA